MQPAARLPVQIPSLNVDDFKILASMSSFYGSDYRLRSYIRRQLERIVKNDLTNALSIQLAICYELGFGCPDNDDQPKRFTCEEIRDHIAAALELETKGESGNIYNNLVFRGHHTPIDLADYYGENRVLEQAERTTRKDIERTTHALGAGDPVVLHLKYVLYSIMDYQGRWNESEKLKAEVLEIHQKTLGREHPDTLTSMANLASTYSDRGQWEEAEKLEVDVLKVRQRTLGREHPDTLTSMANLASTYSDRGQWEEAEKLKVDVLKIRQRILGREHPDTLTSMANLALTLGSQGRWEQAEKLEVQVMKTRKEKLGRDHADTLTSMINLAHTWHDMGRILNAVDLLRGCVRLQQVKLGLSHSETQSSSSTLDDWESKLSRHVINESAVSISPLRAQDLNV